MEHLLRNNEILRPSLGSDISDQLLNELQDTKERIEKQKEDWYIVAVVHASFDTTHASHIQYINTCKQKVSQRLWVPIEKIKLLVWVECDVMTKKRKNWKENIYTEWERKYIIENLKATDRCYIEFEWLDEQNNQSRPAWIVKYLWVNIMLSHQEHYWSLAEYIWVSRRMKDATWWKVIIINYWDEEKYLWEKSNRAKYNLSTTNVIRKIIKNFKWNQKYDL